MTFPPEAGLSGLNKDLRTAEAFGTLWFTGFLIAGGVVTLAVIAYCYVRWSATTDPEKLARTDPWVQKRLAEMEANRAAGEPKV